MAHYKPQQYGERRELESQHAERQQPHDNKKPLQSGTVHQSQLPVRINILTSSGAHAPYQQANIYQGTKTTPEHGYSRLQISNEVGYNSACYCEYHLQTDYLQA